MSALTIVIMAAGLGSRFGGTKQLVEVGPDGEAFLDYGIRDGRAAGGEAVVLVVRSEIEDDVRAHLRRRYGSDAGIRLVCQDRHGPSRPKPWGTAHAVLSAAAQIDGPFLALNADDYYGPSSYRLAAESLVTHPEEAVLVGFELARTLPSDGTVSRGVCRLGPHGELVELVETHGLGWRPDGSIGSGDVEYPGDTVVSMNLWGFPRFVLDELEQKFERFLVDHGDDPKSELYLPSVVAELRDAGRLGIRVVSSGEHWIGVTNAADLRAARSMLEARSR